MTDDSSPRIWEIDFLRGLAIVLMVGYHLLYDLGDFAGLEKFLGFTTDLTTPAWLVAQHSFAGLFVILSGISSNFSQNNFRRSLKYLAVALVISAVTYVFDSGSVILFGIIHCLGVSALIYGLFFKKSGAVACLVTGIIIAALSALLPAASRIMSLDSNWLLPLGLHRPDFASFDYFPLIPWLGVFLVGVALGRWLYTSKKGLFSRELRPTFFNWCGRHSLWIYLLHQPVILGILYFLGYLKL
ncbi:MAG: heparan-alpha-glucosaminide N-acetyltransferase [Candidatus Saccharicenans sp.]|nr:heparan-alpha-glucosaminide N-acetyltransferase [Candidatus Saccharicenans sp.]